MTFKEYRNNCSHTAKFNLQIYEGKNLKKTSYDYDDFDENEEYELDDYEVIQQDANYGMDVHWLTLRR